MEEDGLKCKRKMTPKIASLHPFEAAEDKDTQKGWKPKPLPTFGKKRKNTNTKNICPPKKSLSQTITHYLFQKPTHVRPPLGGGGRPTHQSHQSHPKKCPAFNRAKLTSPSGAGGGRGRLRERAGGGPDRFDMRWGVRTPQSRGDTPHQAAF